MSKEGTEGHLSREGSLKKGGRGFDWSLERVYEGGQFWAGKWMSVGTEEFMDGGALCAVVILDAAELMACV